MRKAQEILISILEKRGIRTEEDISEFLSDRPQRTYDPFLLLNMEAGVDLLLSEAKAGTRICIYGDYDADGVTSLCILSSVISRLTDNIMWYIPSRMDEGYGLNMEAVRRIHEDGAGLIVTVDCGSVSRDEVREAKRLGMKVIVTDHHTCDDTRAECLLINPKQEECSYPFRGLAGCGVAFKMAQAIQKKAGLPKSVLTEILDLAAIGTVGDIVSLTDENRTIVKYGLNMINSGRRPAISKLAEAISLKRITSEAIAYGIAPHINAAGRMGSAFEAVKLFTAEDEESESRQVARLVDMNRERKKKQEEAYEKCMEAAGDDDFVIIRAEDIHEGIGGIVAGKIKDALNRPTVIVTPSGDHMLKGTGRSIQTIDIYRLLKKHSSLMERFGGHRSACGFLMREENLKSLREAVSEDMRRLREERPDIFEKKLYWDEEIDPGEATLELAKKTELMEPFGEGNPRPVFLMKGVRLRDIRLMGEDRTHARFTAVSESRGMVSCVLFNRAQEKKNVIWGNEPVNVTGTLNIQSWQGRERIQLTVEEILPWR